jgi:hypothetical protein
MFQASAGLLLRPDLRKALDSLDISIYYKVGASILPNPYNTLIAKFVRQDGMIYAHSFRLHDAMQYDGMAIPLTRWHIPRTRVHSVALPSMSDGTLSRILCSLIAGILMRISCDCHRTFLLRVRSA